MVSGMESYFLDSSQNYSFTITPYVRICPGLFLSKGFPGGQCERPGFNPWVGKIPWRKERLQFSCLENSCLENSMDRGAWCATVHGNLKESDTTEQVTLSLFFFLKHHQNIESIEKQRKEYM